MKVNYGELASAGACEPFRAIAARYRESARLAPLRFRERQANSQKPHGPDVRLHGQIPVLSVAYVLESGCLLRPFSRRCPNRS